MRFGQIRRWLAQTTEFEPTLLEGRALERVVERRMQRLGIEGEREYLSVMQRDGAECERVLSIIAVSETSFFRYPASYEALAAWLRERLESKRYEHGRLRMLSVACSTGEEAWSMAITAAHAGWDLEKIRIEAVDRNRESIDRARTGSFKADALRKETPSWARPWLEINDGLLRIPEAIRRVVEFRHANAMNLGVPEPPGYDVIFCRNLLIYLSANARRRVFEVLTRSLAPGGRLLLGHSEGNSAIAHSFGAVEPFCAFMFERSTVPPKPPSVPSRRLPEFNGPIRVSATQPAPVSGSPRAVEDMRVEQAQRGGECPLGEARSLADRGAMDAAEDEAIRVMEANGPTTEALELLGSVHLARGALAEAHDCFFRAVYLEPDHRSSLLQLALICDRLGDAEQASRYRRRAVRALESHAGTE